jgi:hypothetical protein
MPNPNLPFPPEIQASVYEMLDCGSARLAYARAKGVSLVPYDIVVSATFSSTSVSLVPDVGRKDKISSDTVVREITYQVTNLQTPAGFDSITNEFFELQSGIVARLRVDAAGGGYLPVPDYQPIKRIARCFPRGWLLSYNMGLKMDFQALVPLPFPVQVDFIFHGETVYWLPAIQMDNTVAFQKLANMGYNVTGYTDSGT